MDPYKILGVSEDADEETIKRAYKELVKKYHPDKYINNPLADLAAEKMKEINKAYDMLTKNKTSSASGTYSGGYYGDYGGGYSYQNAQPTFELVRKLISMGMVVEAINMLNRLPKTAEWFYLSGIANIRRGWYSRGVEDLKKAVDMDPDNAEYRDTLNGLRNNASGYGMGGDGYRSVDCCPLPCWCIPCFCPGTCCC